MAHADVAVVLPKSIDGTNQPRGGRDVNEKLVWYHTPSPCVCKGQCWFVGCSVGKRLAEKNQDDDAVTWVGACGGDNNVT